MELSDDEKKLILEGLDVRMAQIQRAINVEKDEVVVAARKRTAIELRNLSLKIEAIKRETSKANAGK